MRRKKTVTLRDIAEELQLTVHTVSKALRGLPGMSEATRRDVFDAARRLGYKTKEQEISSWYERVPKLLTSGRRFAMLLHRDNPFTRLQLSGLQERFHELGHSVSAELIPSLPHDDGDGRFERWIEQSGLLYADGLCLPPALPERLERRLLALPVPKVLINYPPPLAQVDSVIWDVERAIHQSVQHLVSRGHRNILYVGDIHSHRGFRLRWSAFLSAAGGLPDVDARADAHLTDAFASWEDWSRALGEKLAASRATAVLCAIDSDLPSLLYYLQSVGRSVPADLSVVCLETATHPFSPRIARPALLVREAGRRAAERLLWRIANPDAPYEHIRLAGGFIEGDSVATIG